MSDPDITQPTPRPQASPPTGATPTGYQRTTGGQGVKWLPPSPERLAELLPQYQVEALIGRGGMGAVYKGMQKTLERPVAIKILPPEIDDEDASFTERFKNEAKIMARLEHPAIVPVYDFGETSDGLLYFVMGFINGTDIHQMIQSQGRLPPEHALAITAHVCDALQYAHSHGVVHRDIKPSNILINMQGQVKVADFGLAKAQDNAQSHGLTKTGMAMGTPDYVAPEALMMGVQTDGRADLYAVGVMLYQMLTGQVPRGAFDLPSKISGCDPRFDRIVMQAMKYDREERYSTAMDLRRDLDVILTAPLVRSGGQGSAAIPMAQVAQEPTGKPPQSQSDAGTPARKQSPPAGKSARTTSEPPAKSKTPLLIGIGAVAAIAVGAFVMMGGKKKDTAAGSQTSASAAAKAGIPSGAPQLASSPANSTAPIKVREEPKSTAPAPAIPNLKSPISNAAPAAFPPGQWVKVFTKAEDLPEDLRKAGVKLEDGWIRFGQEKRSLKIPDSEAANFAVRARIRAGTTKDYNKIVLRGNDGKPAYQVFTSSLTKLFIQKWIQRGDVTTLGNIDVSAAALGNDYLLEFAAVGSRLIGRVGDSSPMMVNDDSLKRGKAHIYGAEDLRDIEVINLDGIPEAEALKILGVDEKGNDLRQPAVASSNLKSPISNPAAASPAPSATAPASAISNSKSPISNAAPAAFPPGQWVKMFTKFEDLPEDHRRPNSGVKFEDGWIRYESATGRRLYVVDSFSNYAIRAKTLRMGKQANSKTLFIRAMKAPGTEGYSLGMFDGRILEADRVLSSGEKENLWKAISPEAKLPQVGEEYALEWGCVGDKLIGRLNKDFLKVITDSGLSTGPGFFTGGEPVRDIEVINLDGLPEAEALKLLGVDEKGNDLRQKPAAVASATPAASSPAPASSSPSLPVSKSSAPAFPPGQWVKVFTKFEDLPEELRKAGVKLEDGWIRFGGKKSVPLGFGSGQNYGVRARFSRKVDSNDPGRIVLRSSGDSQGYLVGMSGSELACQKFEHRQYPKLFATKIASHARRNDPYVLEFAAIGSRLIGRYGSEAAQTAFDTSYTNGSAYLGGSEDIRDIEVINLDGLPEAEALRILGVDEKGNDLRALAAKQEQQQAEMAKAVDAMAAIPELKVLHEQFVKLQGERVTAPFEADVAKLNAGYLGGLDRKMTELKQKGDLDGVLALEAEKKLIQGGGVSNSPSSDGTSKVPLPADDDTTVATLKDLRKIYRDAFAKLEAARAANLKALTDPLDTRLKQIESTLTQKNRIDHAKVVREYREGLGKEGSADIPSGAAQPVRNAMNGGAAATTNEAGNSARAPLKKLPPGDDRKAAEWALDMGGVIDVMEGKVKRRIQSKADLPKRSFDLVYISIQADRPTKPVIEFTNLSALAGLRQLSFLEINGYSVQDDDTDYLATLPELKELQIVRSLAFSGRKLALLKDAEKLERLNVGGCLALAAEGIAQISQLSELTSVIFNDCKFADADLPPLRQLKKLTNIGLSNTPITLAGWKELKGLPLTKAVFVSPPGEAAVWCREIATLFPSITSFDVSRREPFPVEDISAAKAFAGLEEFIVSSTYTENAALAELAAFPKLTKLTLRGGGAGPAATVTDEGIAHLAKLRTLQTLRLENLSEITEQGLIGLKQLKRLEVPSSSCPKFNEAVFKKARPDVTLAK